MKKFIIWDFKRDGHPQRNDTGEFVSGGVFGFIDEDNVYLTTYAQYPGERRPKDLMVGERIQNVKFNLSGEKGVYDIWRVA